MSPYGEYSINHPLPLAEKQQPKAKSLQRKEAFGSYGEPLLLSAASVSSTAVFSKLTIHQNSAFVKGTEAIVTVSQLVGIGVQ